MCAIVKELTDRFLVLSLSRESAVLSGRFCDVARPSSFLTTLSMVTLHINFTATTRGGSNAGLPTWQRNAPEATGA